MQLVNDIYNITNTYPKEEMYSLISQTKRAAISIPANIAEGIGRQYKKDTLQFLHIARGSLYELETLLHISLMRVIINKENADKIFSLIQKNLQVLNGYINYLRKAKLK
jgi:four helix bundle protein